MDRQQAIQLIRRQGSKVFTVVFRKKDGTLRKMNCRLGVKKHLKGGTLAYDPAEHGLITVFDMEKNGYRSINVETLEEVHAEGQHVKIAP